MLMADDGSNYWSVNDLSGGGDGWDDLCIDLDSFWDIMRESPDPSQNRLEDSSLNNVPQGVTPYAVGDNKHLQFGLPKLERAPLLQVELPESVTSSSSHNLGTSYFRKGVSDGSFNNSIGDSIISDSVKLEPTVHITSPVHSNSRNHSDWLMCAQGCGSFPADMDGVSQNASYFSKDDSKESQDEMPSSSITFGFAAGDANQVPDISENVNFCQMKGVTEFKFRCSEGDTCSEYSFPNQLMESSDINTRGKFFDSSGDIFATLEVPNIEDTYAMDVDISSHSASQTCPNYFEISDNLCKTDCLDSTIQHCLSTGDSFYSGSSMQFLSNVGFQCLSNDDEIMFNTKDESEELPTHFECFNTGIIDEPMVERAGETVSEASAIANFNVRGSIVGCDGGDHISVTTRKCSDKVNGSITFETALEKPLPLTLSISSQNHAVYMKEEKEDAFLSAKKACHSFDFIDETDCKNPTIAANRCGVRVSGQSCLEPQYSFKEHLGCTKKERESKLTTGSHCSNTSHQIVQSNELALGYHADDDSDICILEDLSNPACCNISVVNGKSLGSSQHATFTDPINHRGVGGFRLKSNERFIFNVVLQDLSQPKSEAIPPDGLLVVPLLRHQRIALSWMVQKETASLHCSGGILADDQGLGKTISTIALILKERSPSSTINKMDLKQSEMETLNLDEDDNDVSNVAISKQESDSCQVDRRSVKGRSTPQGKGRPAAGTLIVCPTSVLRQWSEELHNKVTSKANLSVLVYHGSNRTKDPFELAKYDVVLTTYSIVSMEVPKQPLVDEDSDETGKQGNVASMGLPSSKKRKYPFSSTERCLKGKKGIDGELLEAVARPLARVGWFRIVLDEAQSIKNHRTQVARACWGLRAKRRWCLSGTPIQNAVDDLYSYFRFLRYDPYAVYKSFCSSIKVPIHKNPTNGYKKLQAVLKTIMLRRTKGTLLDGEPIINLPPKSVELKKVDFTKEERDFYCRLEADSRAQFAEYAAAGTVKQNYVNILLMLLRLRQACDHPFLVSGCNSNSVWRSSVDMAKKLPWEKLVRLLNCLETSLAICGLCSDPPEDAVVASCGHVFCNQCICEHLTGDDNQCPMTNCKAQLSVSLVFSRATLRSALSDQPGLERTSNCSGSELAERFESCSSDCSYDSSKIKAALEVLQSLSRPQDCRLRTIEEGVGSSLNSPDSPLGGFHCDVHDGINLNLKKTSSDLDTIVGEKAIVFSQWTRMLDLLEACLKNASINYRRLDGTMSVVARDKAVKDFNTLPEVSVMIMSLKAASLGLNMVAACHVLLLDLWWNPTTEDQAIDRAHRIGQTRPVTVLRLTVKDTVEDRILALQQKKREMVASAFGEDEIGGRQTRLTVEDLKYLFMA